MMRFFKFGWLITTLVFAATTSNTWADLTQQRAVFKRAQEAVSKKRLGEFAKLERSLKTYPLYPVVKARALRQKLSSQNPAFMAEFIAKNLHAAEVEDLRVDWLKQLAKRKQWKSFLALAPVKLQDRALECQRLLRLLRTQKTADLKTDFENVWSTGKSLPDECDALIAAFHKAGFISQDLAWERIKSVIRKGNVGLATFLAKNYLNQSNRVWANRWIQAVSSPSLAIKQAKQYQKNEIGQDILLDAIRRIAVRNPRQAMRTWRASAIGVNKSFASEAVERIALYTALDHLPESVDWYNTLEKSFDPRARAWRVRANLRTQNWPGVITAINTLPEADKRENVWRYWLARALEQQDKTGLAEPIFKSLAGQRDFYGFLAADRLSMAYAMNDRELQVENELLKKIEDLPGMKIAQELFAFGETWSARKQWNWTAKKFAGRDAAAASLIAQKWAWYDRPIFALSSIKAWDHLALRFPLAHEKYVAQSAERFSVDPSWVYGIIRQESAFLGDARSSAGALGLMQLMPGTAKRTGKRIGLKVSGRYSILKTANNINLGSAYISTVARQYANNAALATASYNAGPHRAKKWLPKKRALPGDIWVETIPFKETRRYVKNVLAYAKVYDYRRGVEGERVTKLLGTIQIKY